MKFVGVSEVRLVDDREINFRTSPLNIALESMPKLMPSGCFDRGISLCPRVCAPELLDEFQACNESTIAAHTVFELIHVAPVRRDGKLIFVES